MPPPRKYTPPSSTDIDADAKPLPKRGALAYVPWLLLLDAAAFLLTLAPQQAAGAPGTGATVVMAVYFSLSFLGVFVEKLVWFSRLMRFDRFYLGSTAALAQLVALRLRERVVLAGLFYVFWSFDRAAQRDTFWSGMDPDRSPFGAGATFWTTATLVITGTGFSNVVPVHPGLHVLVGVATTVSDIFWYVVASFVFALVFELSRISRRKPN